MSRYNLEPPTAEDFKNLEEVFRRLPSYREEGIISSDDVLELLKGINYKDCTPEEFKIFKDYMDQRFGGILRLSKAFEFFAIMNDNASIAKKLASAQDVDRDGFISKDEFKEITRVLVCHDDRLKEASFEDFVKVADTNQDGKVSIDECTHWITKSQQE